MTCKICEQIKNKDVLYLNEDFAVIIPDKIYAPGHILVVPTEHHTILEQVSKKQVGVLFNAANKVSSLLFEGLGAHGTNLMIRNGIPAGQEVGHVAIEVVPRWQQDNIALQWQPLQLSDEVFDTAFLKLSNLKETIVEQPEEEQVVEIKETPKEAPKSVDYRIKALRRIP